MKYLWLIILGTCLKTIYVVAFNKNQPSVAVSIRHLQAFIKFNDNCVWK